MKSIMTSHTMEMDQNQVQDINLEAENQKLAEREPEYDLNTHSTFLTGTIPTLQKETFV